MEELEFTYLVKELPSNFKTVAAKEMLDIYLPASAHHPNLRIRRAGDKYEITKKQPIEAGDSSRQLETTIPLTVDEFADLQQLPGKRVEKTRFYYQENGINYEIDVFRGALSGLVLVDVEFKSREEENNFVPPKWWLVEVTQEKFIAGGMLCGKSFNDIEDRLKEFGYVKLKI